MKARIRKIIPRQIFSIYHLILSFLAGALYCWPSRKMIVVGVTGTKGKSTVAYLLAKILEMAGFRVGLTSTAIFKIAGREWLNDTKMTMLGRFALQRMLRDMVKAGCAYAIVETSSEGIVQNRHRGIDYDAAIFTNLTPEHIESHGGFENYKKAKGKLFASLIRSRKKELNKGKKTIIANLDDENAEYFLGFWADEKWGYGINFRFQTCPVPSLLWCGVADFKLADTLQAQELELRADGSSFKVNGEMIDLKLIGKGNVYNALAAMAVAASQGVPFSSAAAAISKIEYVPGRMEFIREGQPFGVIVDYAHEPESTRQLYEAIKFVPHKRVIHVFGSTGGGRDVARRRVLGQFAGEGADIVFVTTDDPYDDDPQKIADAVKEGALEKGKILGKDLFVVLDRREAIARALGAAKENDLVLITGKGSEQAMVVSGGKKIPWDDRLIAREELNKIKN